MCLRSFLRSMVGFISDVTYDGFLLMCVCGFHWMYACFQRLVVQKRVHEIMAPLHIHFS